MNGYTYQICPKCGKVIAKGYEGSMIETPCECPSELDRLRTENERLRNVGGACISYAEKQWEEKEEEVRRLRARVEGLETRLVRCLPMCFVCPECGPFAEVDEDDCCTSCGRDCEIKDSRAALEGESR